MSTFSNTIASSEMDEVSDFTSVDDTESQPSAVIDDYSDIERHFCHTTSAVYGKILVYLPLHANNQEYVQYMYTLAQELDMHGFIQVTRNGQPVRSRLADLLTTSMIPLPTAANGAWLVQIKCKNTSARRIVFLASIISRLFSTIEFAG